MPSDMPEHAHFPRTANSPSRLNSVVTEQNSETEFKMAAPCADLKYELFSLCLDRFGGLNGNFNHSHYCNTLLRPYLCLWPIAYLFWSAWYSANATATTASGWRPCFSPTTERNIIKRLKGGRDVTSEVRVGSQRILKRTIRLCGSDSAGKCCSAEL